MAALTADDMLYPRVGQLKAEVVWPAATYRQSVKQAKDALNGGLLELGYARADELGFTGDDRDTAAQHQTAYLAYRGRLAQMGGLPGSVDVRDEGSSSYSADQRALIERLMNDELDALDALVEAGTSTLLAPRTSRSVRACFEFP